MRTGKAKAIGSNPLAGFFTRITCFAMALGNQHPAPGHETRNWTSHVHVDVYQRAQRPASPFRRDGSHQICRKAVGRPGPCSAAPSAGCSPCTRLSTREERLKTISDSRYSPRAQHRAMRAGERTARRPKGYPIAQYRTPRAKNNCFAPLTN